MKRSPFTPRLGRTLLAFSLSFAASTHVFADEPTFVPLFNGKDLSSFNTETSARFWRVENGVLIGENDPALKGDYLTTEKTYRDFIIEFDVRWTATTPRGVDTGLEMRSPPIQLQLGVSGSLRVDMSGSFYTGGKPAYPEDGQAKDARTLMKP
ncbi:MAG TPA: family 16 glycoside hydrolase, partial [Opitutus sp.]|nr:family 16 glycoside hydrolase [Opitutus sp.]